MLKIAFLAIFIVAIVHSIPVPVHKNSEQVGEICKLIVENMDKNLPKDTLLKIKYLLLDVMQNPEGYDGVATPYALNHHQQITANIERLVEHIKDYLPFYVLDRIQHILEIMNRADSLYYAERPQTFPLYFEKEVKPQHPILQVPDPRIPSDFLMPVQKPQTFPLYFEKEVKPQHPILQIPEHRIPSDFLRPVPKPQTYPLYLEKEVKPQHPILHIPEHKIPSDFLRPAPKPQTFPLYPELPNDFLRPAEPKFGLRPVKENRIPSDFLRPQEEFMPNKKPHYPHYPKHPIPIRPLPEYIPNNLLPPEFLRPEMIPDAPTVLLPLKPTNKE